MKNTFPKIVFCDFDGTITVDETFVGMLSRFAPERMKAFRRNFSEGSVTLREGVPRVVESIPSAKYPEMVAYVRDKDIRPGFRDFLEFLNGLGIPFVVISGGLLDSVNTRLAAYNGLIHAVYAADVDNSGEYVKVVSRFEEGDELVAKVRVMSLYRFEACAVIGDGATDRNMALNASLVFARDRLAVFLEKNGYDYIPWNDFYDIEDHLKRRWL
ncbi:MAG: HAD-IB family phosphatase [Desulfobacterales bacterium]